MAYLSLHPCIYTIFVCDQHKKIRNINYFKTDIKDPDLFEL